ncbi:hypothetical protein WJX74_007382 [Apatococcus lobatus]|uniref:Bro-N domain-containing protein n=1 Tax=Apatococcus lobatus TaxID=904363 RepID=A0AAW1SGL1_9CHLO
MLVGKQSVPIAFFEKNSDAPWFKAKPLITYLEYKNITTTLEKVEAEDKNDLKTLVAQRGSRLGVDRAGLNSLSYHEGKAIWISEFGLYDLIMGSEKREARSLKRWVTHELLPTLRRTGEYRIEPVTPAKPADHSKLVDWHKQRADGKEATVRANLAIKAATGNLAAGWDYAKIHDAHNWAATGRKTKQLRAELGIRGTPRDHMAAPQLSMVAYVEAMTAEKVGRKRLAAGADIPPTSAVDEAGRLSYTAHDFTRGTGGHDVPLLAQAPPTLEQLGRALRAAEPTKRQRLTIERAAMRPAAALPAPGHARDIASFFCKRTVPAGVPESELDLYD